MAYSIFYTSASKKDLKKISKEVIKIIIERHYPVLLNNPYNNKRLTNPFKNCWKYYFSYKGTEYRIIYQIFKKELQIIIILIGSRENLYKELKRRI